MAPDQKNALPDDDSLAEAAQDSPEQATADFVADTVEDAAAEADAQSAEQEPEDAAAIPDEESATQATADIADDPAADAAAETSAPSAIEPIGPHDLPGDNEAITALKNMEAKRKRRKRNRIIKIAIAAAVVAVALILYFMRDTLFPPETPEATPETMEVTRQDFTTTVQGSGALKAGSTAVVTPEVSGIIEEVLVTDGQQVSAGDVVVTLRNADLDKAVSAAADDVSAASTEVYNAQIAVSDLQQAYYAAVDNYNWSVAQNAEDVRAAKLAGDIAYEEAYEKAIAAIPKDASKEERKRLKAEAKETAQLAYQEAYDSVPITEIMEYDDASYVSEIDSAQSGVAAAQTSLNKAQSDYNDAVEQADKRQVKAPVSGTVLALEAVPGAAVGGAEGGTASSSSSGALMQISDMSRLKVSIEVNEVDILAIAKDQKAKVTFSALPELELDATVSSVASVATGSGDSMGGGGGVATFTVDLDIDQVDERLKPGMTASVRIITHDEQDVIVVPTAALQEDGDAAYVKVAVGDDPTETEMREVKVGTRSTTQAVIESGLEEGETIVYGGMSLADLGAGDDDGGMAVDVAMMEG